MKSAPVAGLFPDKVQDAAEIADLHEHETGDCIPKGARHGAVAHEAQNPDDKRNDEYPDEYAGGSHKAVQRVLHLYA